jgi:hypothetical protein
MRKRIIGYSDTEAGTPEGDWLDLASIAEVEVSSEAHDHPVEGALLPSGASPWRAAEPGVQKLRLVFDSPQSITRIKLRFDDAEGRERTQEFKLGCVRAGDERPREILRQQFNFSAGGARCEIEDYRVSLDEVQSLELTVIPDINGGDAYATLSALRVS